LDKVSSLLDRIFSAIDQFFSHYYFLIVFLLTLFILALIIWALLKLRHLNKRSYIIERRVHDTSESIVDLLAIQGKRSSIKMDEANTRITAQLNKIQGEVTSTLTSLQAFQERSATSSDQLQDSLYDISNNLSSSSTIQHDVHNLYARVEKLNEELIKANQWFEDMKALEKVVIKLVGHEKMIQLIEKEKAIKVQEIKAVQNKDIL